MFLSSKIYPKIFSNFQQVHWVIYIMQGSFKPKCNCSPWLIIKLDRRRVPSVTSISPCCFIPKHCCLMSFFHDLLIESIFFFFSVLDETSPKTENSTLFVKIVWQEYQTFEVHSFFLLQAPNYQFVVWG